MENPCQLVWIKIKFDAPLFFLDMKKSIQGFFLGQYVKIQSACIGWWSLRVHK